MDTKIEIKKSAYEAPQTSHVQVETEGGFAGSLNNSPTGSTTLQDWTYTNDTSDSDTWS